MNAGVFFELDGHLQGWMPPAVQDVAEMLGRDSQLLCQIFLISSSRAHSVTQMAHMDVVVNNYSTIKLLT